MEKSTTYIIRRTQSSDITFLPAVEASASNAFRSIPELSWLADSQGMSLEAHKDILETSYSWVAIGPSQTCVGFLTATIMEDDFHIAEISVHETYQKKGIGSKLFETAFVEAKSLGLQAVTLTTFKDVPWNAPYYKRLGFSVLGPQAIPSYLQTILRNEGAAGLPIGRRCAMRRTL